MAATSMTDSLSLSFLVSRYGGGSASNVTTMLMAAHSASGNRNARAMARDTVATTASYTKSFARVDRLVSSRTIRRVRISC
jgi:hypothetical protein